ncbi:MAG: SprT-like domain-containing protein [Cytophagales bacterium]
MSKIVNPKDVFYQYFPASAVEYCFQLWQQYQFYFKINKKRQTRLGDYRFHTITKLHTITVNADLNPLSFLVTYLHEVAHLINQVKNGSKVEPHGKEWKNEFIAIAKPMLNTEVFPSFVLDVLAKYFKNPKASSCSDHELQKALQWFDEGGDHLYLSDIQIGKLFEFNKRQFQKEEIRRTRILCKEIATGKKYLISKMAKVSALG